MNSIPNVRVRFASYMGHDMGPHYKAWCGLRQHYRATQGDVFSASELARLRYWRWAYRHRLMPAGLDGVDSIATPIAIG